MEKNVLYWVLQYKAKVRMNMEELLDILSNLFPDVDFETEDRLVDDKILDSYDLDSIVTEIEDQFEVTIPAEMVNADNFNSAESMYDLIQKLDE